VAPDKRKYLPGKIVASSLWPDAFTDRKSKLRERKEERNIRLSSSSRVLPVLPSILLLKRGCGPWRKCSVPAYRALPCGSPQKVLFPWPRDVYCTHSSGRKLLAATGLVVTLYVYLVRSIEVYAGIPHMMLFGMVTQAVFYILSSSRSLGSLSAKTVERGLSQPVWIVFRCTVESVLYS
jgi:hypothetical protein